MPGKEFAISFIIGAALAGSFKGAFGTVNRKFAELNWRLKGSNSMLKAVDNSFKSGAINAKSYSNAVRKISTNMRNIGKAKMNNGLSDFAKWGGFAAGAFSVGKSIVDVAETFEASMSKVQAITGSNADEMAKLSKVARELGKTTQYSASEAGDAMSYLGMAGWNTEQIMAGMPGLLSLAAASGTDLATTADIVSDDLTAFGMKAGDAGRMADVMAAASSNANTNVTMMGETFKYAAPVAGALGYSLEDVAVATGLMANAGIKGEQAGTSLRATMSRLVDPPKEAATAMAALGIEVKNSDGTMKPLSKTMQELRSRFRNLSEAERAQYAGSIAGTNAMSGFLALVNSSDDDFDKLTKAINNSQGSAKKMADTMNGNTQGALRQLKSATEEAQIALGNAFLPAVSELAKKGAEAASVIADFSSKHPALIENLTLAAAGVVAFNLAVSAGTAISGFATMVAAGARMLTGFSIAQGLATAAQWAFNTSLWGCPIIVIAGAIAVAAYIIYKEWDKISAWFHNFFDWLAEKWEWVSSKLSGMQDWINKPIFGGGNVKVEHNASGGIYGRGAFLTTFAEDSGESAIPHTPTRHNIGLLARTNEIMGNPLGGGGITATFAPQITVNGSADVAQIDSIMENEMREFEMRMKQLMNQKRRLSYG